MTLHNNENRFRPIIMRLMTRYPIVQWRYVFVIVLGMAAQSSLMAQAEKITFADHVRPIFQRRCAACHNPDRQSGGLDLTNFTNMMQGGGSGQPVEPGDADSSYLYSLVTHDDSPEMPPGGERIPENEIIQIAAWINGGALETKASIAQARKTVVVNENLVTGARPTHVARPPRMSLQPEFFPPQSGSVTAIAVSPWTTIAAISVAKQVLIYDTQHREFLGSLAFPEGQAEVLAFSRNGQLLLAGGGRHGLSGKVVIWDVASAERLTEVGNERDNVLAADISADLSMIAMAGPEKMVRVYDINTGELRYEIKKTHGLDHSYRIFSGRCLIGIRRSQWWTPGVGSRKWPRISFTWRPRAGYCGY